MKRATLQIEVDDNFKPGQCFKCPLAYEEYYPDPEADDGLLTEVNCPLMVDSPKCPLKVEEVEQ